MRPLLILLLLAGALRSEEAHDFEACLDEGKNLLAERRFEEARGWFDKAARLQASSAEAWAGLGDCYYGLGRAALARKSYLYSLKLDPEQPRVKEFLAKHLPEGVEDEGAAAATGRPRSWVQAGLRSAVLPGWGQVYNKQNEKGIVLGLVTLSLLGSSLGTYMAADGAYKDYLSLGPGTSEGDFGEAFSKVEGWATANHVSVLLFYSAYAYTIGDAMAGAKPKSGLGLRLDRKGTVMASAEWRF